MDSIRLQNFQAHKDTLIELSPTLTTITGKSHHGKSSVVRAFKWMRDNKPKKPRFIRKGVKKSTVTIGTVRHERTEKTNKYFIEGKKDPFTALRGAVPEEVQQALGFGEDNIQNQHDSIFLLNDSPGKVAQKLSGLVDLESTTTALKYIASRKRGHNANVESLRKLIEDTEGQLEKLEHVDTADADLAEIEAEGVYIKRLHEKHTKVSTAIENVSRADLELSKIPSIAALEPAKSIAKLHNEVQVLIEEQKMVGHTVWAIEKFEAELQFDPSKLLKKAKRVCGLNDKLGTVSFAVMNAESIGLEIDDLIVEEIDLKEKKDKLLEGTCPLCGRSE